MDQESAMPGTQQFQITLPLEMAEELERKVASGAYASVSEVVREGILTLLDRDVSLEEWLRGEVVESIEESRANPDSTIPADRIMERVRETAQRKETAA
jgi:antitoxin ParD1/3/4